MLINICIHKSAHEWYLPSITRSMSAFYSMDFATLEAFTRIYPKQLEFSNFIETKKRQEYIEQYGLSEWKILPMRQHHDSLYRFSLAAHLHSNWFAKTVYLSNLSILIIWLEMSPPLLKIKTKEHFQIRK